MSSSPARSSWHLARLGRLAVGWAKNPAIDAGRLHPRERRWLDRMDQRPARRAEWIAGRLGLARLLPPGAAVLARPDGTPAVVGAAWAASISHEDGWVAVAARPGAGRVAVDLVPVSAAPAAARALARARVNRPGDTGEPAAAWAALECAAKLRGIGVAALLDRRARIAELTGGRLRISGLGRPVHVSLRHLPGAVLAVADEAS